VESVATQRKTVGEMRIPVTTVESVATRRRPVNCRRKWGAVATAQKLATRQRSAGTGYESSGPAGRVQKDQESSVNKHATSSTRILVAQERSVSSNTERLPGRKSRKRKKDNRVRPVAAVVSGAIREELAKNPWSRQPSKTARRVARIGNFAVSAIP